MSTYRLTYKDTDEVEAESPKEAIATSLAQLDGAHTIECLDHVEEVIPQPNLTRTIERKFWDSDIP